MKKLENLKEFQLKNEVKDIYGGGVFPQSGTWTSEVSCMEGQTVFYTSNWRTGWFSKEKIWEPAVPHFDVSPNSPDC